MLQKLGASTRERERERESKPTAQNGNVLILALLIIAGIIGTGFVAYQVYNSRSLISPVSTNQPTISPTPTPEVKPEVSQHLNVDLSSYENRLSQLEQNYFSFANSSLPTTFSFTDINLLRNPSFEQEQGSNQPRYWTYMFDSTTSNTFRSAEGIHSGSYGLKFVGNKGAGIGLNLGISQPDTKTVPGRTYTFSAFIKIINNSSATIRLGFWDEQNNKYGEIKSFDYSQNFDWKRITFTVTTPGIITDSKNYYPIIEVRGLKDGSVYLDDVQLEEGSALTIYNTAAAYSNSAFSSLGGGSILGGLDGNLYPATTGVGGLGTSSNNWNSLYLSSANIDKDGNLTLNGSTTIKGGFNSSLIPNTTTTYDLGSSSLYWNNLYAKTMNISGGQAIGGDMGITGALGVTGATTLSNLSTGIVQANSLGLLSSNLGTLNYIPKWNSSGLSTTSTIFDNGNVGIGTTNPTQKLSVQGNGLFSGDLSAANITSTETLQAKTVYDSNDVKYWGAKGDGVTDDTNAFKTTLTHTNNLTISIAGTYLLSSPIYLSSGQHIKGSSNVILKKSVSYSHVFANYAATTTGAVPDSDISIENLTIDANNLGTLTGAASLTAAGVIQFTYADKIKIQKVSIINGAATLFGVHFQSVTNSLIEDFVYLGLKDGIHIGGGSHDIVINRWYIDNYDDAIAIMTDEYPHYQHNAQDIRNIVIENGVSNSHYVPTQGYVIRFITGSWLAWSSGNSYSIGHTVTNGGNLYKMVNAGPTVGTVAPTHVSGDVTGADGIQWRWIGAGVNLNSNIYNVKISNIQIYDGRTIIRLILNESNDHGEYPGTENTSTVDGVYFTNVTSTGSGSIFGVDSGKVGLFGQSFIGKVGIGTTAPQLPLSVVGKGGFGALGQIITIGGVSGLSGERVSLSYNSAVALGELMGVSGVGLGLGTNGVDNVVINSVGNVGIGTTNPTTKLDVAGTIGITGGNNLRVYNSGTSWTGNYEGFQIRPSSNIWYLQSSAGGTGTVRPIYIDGQGANVVLQPTSGNVGIGVLSPTSKLDLSTEGLTAGVHLMKYVGDNTINPTTPTFANSYLHLGGGEYSVGKLQAMTFGYHPLTDTTVNAPAYLGYVETSVSGKSMGDLVFGTRGVVSDTLATERIRIMSSGNVGIGTTSPSAKLDVNGNLNISGYATASASLAVGYSNAPAGPGNAIFSGNVGIGTTSPGAYKTYINGSLAVNSDTADKTGSTSWGTLSDVRLKDIQGNYTLGLKEIMQLNAIKFNYKADNPLGLDSTKTYEGFSAQDVQKIIPEAISTRADGYLRLDADPIMWAMLNAIKEQQGEIASQSATVSDMGISFNTRTLTADTIKAGQIEGIEFLQKDVSDLQALGKSLITSLNNHENRLTTLEQKLIPGLTFDSEKQTIIASNPIDFIKEAIFEGVTTFKKAVTYLADVTFGGKVTFKDRLISEDKDLAGYAKIKQGDKEVKITYEKPYEIQPVVNVTAKKENISFAVTDESKESFTIKLSSVASEDINFSWVAVAIKDVKTYESSGSAQLVTPTPTPSIIPPSDSTSTPSPTPTLTPTIEASPSPTP